MSDITDFLNDTIVASATVVIFPQGGDDTETPWESVEDATRDLVDPWVSFVTDDDMLNAVVGEVSSDANIVLRSREGDAMGVYFLASPVDVDDVPEDYGVEAPLPGEEWAFDWADHQNLFAFAGDTLKLVETDDVPVEDVEEPSPEGAVVEGPETGDGAAAADEDGPAVGGDGGSPDAAVGADGLGSIGAGDVPASDAREPAGAVVPDAVEQDRPETDEAAPVKLNAATIIGTDTPAFNEALGRDVEVLTGLMYGAGNKRNTLDGDWTAVRMPLIDLIKGFDGSADTPEFGFSRHPEAKKKEGPCIVLGSSIDGARKAKAMKTMSFLGLDIDSGAALKDILPRLIEKKIFCLVHTSFNHGKSGLQLRRDEVLRKLGIKTDPTLEEVQEYLRLHDKSRYEESFIQAVTIKTAKMQVKDGVVIELDTPPLDKIRLIFPLAAPVEIISLAETHQGALDDWEDAVTGMAHSVLGVHFDTSCTDPSRLFYTPRHPKGDTNWKSFIVMGDPLDYASIPRVKKAQYTKNRDLNAFVQADDGDGPQKVKTIFLPSGAVLNDWHSKAGKSRFMLADLLETYCQDRIRVAGGEKSGHVHTECPFEHEHTSEGGTGTMAINALDNSSGYWSWFCHHDACQSRHKTELLGEAINRGWFDEELLMDDEFLMPPEDDEIDEDAEEVRAQEAAVRNGTAPDDAPKGPPSADDLIEKVFIEKDGSEVSDKEKAIRKLFGRLAKRGVDAVERQRINKLMKDKSGLDLNTLKSFWRDIDNAAFDEERDQNAKTAPIVTEADFDKMVEYAENRIAAANAEEARLFHYMDRLAEVRDDQNSDAKIALLDRDGFAAFLNRVTRYQAKISDKKSRHVAAPETVVRHIFASAYQPYPPLRGLVTSPTFSATGQIIMEPGYHHGSALYYQPNHSLVVPHVDSVPSEDQVNEAKRLLIEEVFADFPIGGRARPEIVEECLNGDGIPAMAHLLAFVLLPFCREMIDGPTPGHLVVKPSPGTGASLLTEVASIISTGFVTPSMAMPGNKDEMGKTLTSVLANGQNIVFFDNINDKVDSAELASALTAKTYSARILGKSQTVEVEVRPAWIFTGNNVQLSGELVRRLIMIDLDAQCANPELRTGFKHGNLRGWVEKNRGLLVWACLTLVQNWVAKGMPDSGTGVQASYENWSRVLGGILNEAGVGGFLGNRDELERQANAEGADDLVTLLEFWWEKVGSATILIDDPDKKTDTLCSIAKAGGVDLPVRKVRDDDGESVYSKQSFGQFLTKYKNRVYELEDSTNVLLKRGTRTRHGFSWSLVKTEKPQGRVRVREEDE